MSNSSNRRKKIGDSDEGWGNLLIKVFGLLGGGAVVFYVLGFIVVQTFIYKNEIEGMFWFTNEFYRDAGAKFLLEMVRAPLLAFYVFLPYLLILFFLVPKKENLEKASSANESSLVAGNENSTELPSEQGTLAVKQWMKVTSLVIIMALTYAIALSFDYLIGKEGVSKFITNVFPNPTNYPSPVIQQSLAFFSMVMPIVIALALFLYHFRGRLLAGSKSRIAYQVTFVAYLLFLTIVPIAFGFHLYDWKIVPVEEPQVISNLISEDKPQTSLRLWLLGRFGDKYLFFKKTGIKARGVVEVFDEEQIKFLNFDPKRADSLRAQMEESFDPSILNKGKKLLNQSLVLDIDAGKKLLNQSLE
jgi:hypothetical protein